MTPPPIPASTERPERGDGGHAVDNTYHARESAAPADARMAQRRDAGASHSSASVGRVDVDNNDGGMPRKEGRGGPTETGASRRRGAKPISMTLRYTFAAMGFGTGWSSVDSIFQELNKYVEQYDDLGFASDLVFVTSASSAVVFVITFMALYAAPSWVELRNVRFFEFTISFVLTCSCVVQIVLAVGWSWSRTVVETCAFVGAFIGNLQAFVIYPFFTAFYRTELISSMNVGETMTSVLCGALALAQSPARGVENFSVTTFFLLVLAASLASAVAWTSLRCQTGYRKEDGLTEEEQQEAEGGYSEEGGGGRGDVERGGDRTGTKQEREETKPLLQDWGGASGKERERRRRSWFIDERAISAGSAMGHGSHGIAVSDAEGTDSDADEGKSADGEDDTGKYGFGSAKDVDDRRERRQSRLHRQQSYFDVVSDSASEYEPEKGRVEGTKPLGGFSRVQALISNTKMALSGEGQLRSVLPLAVINSLLTWSVMYSLVPYAAAAASDSCDPTDPESRMFVRMCTSFSSICRVFGPLAVSSNAKGWGHPNVVKTVAIVGLCFNFYFCLPAFLGPMNGYWATQTGKWSLLISYMLSTPVEPFVQLHLLIITQRENKGSSKRIIDTGFACAAAFVLLGYVCSALVSRFTATGTAVCPPMEEIQANAQS